MSAKPFVLEAACRSRVDPMEATRGYREGWANVRAIVLVKPLIMPQRTLLDDVKQALPEVERLQPAGMPCDIVISKGYLHSAFAKSLGGVLAAPVNREAFDPRRIAGSLKTRPKIVIEDDTGTGLCCVCSKKGALGKRPSVAG